MPPSLPLLERLATHGLHRTHHAGSRRQASAYDSSVQVIRDALTVLPAGIENARGDRSVRLNWKMLQVRLPP